ncbi:TPA: glycosyltransferase [Pseudomonas putida]
MNLVQQARQAHAEKNYTQAIEIYRRLGTLIGEQFFSANIELCKRRLQPTRQAAKVSARPLPSHDSSGLIYADQIKVALIADEFTTNSFSDEFQALPIEPDNWRMVFEDNKPDVFFCESAWSGPDSVKRPWKGRIYASKNFARENRNELLAILKYCREHGIPTVFWNKEDPTHHTDRVHDFVKTSQEFDFVFTTAEECVDSYKNNYNIKNAYALPFATNPKLFNPIEVKPRSSNVVFAGSWYANHKERSADMSLILDRIMSYGHHLEIYDRYFSDNDPLHEWPDSYKPYLLPSRPHNEMPEVYKAGVFGLNFNTVTNSPTMFARRVFELMSSNTLVISNHSVGTKEMFGDLIIYPDKEPLRLRDITPKEIDDIRDKALIKVLKEHTYTQRWHTILEKIGIPFSKRTRNISFVSKVSSRVEALESISWFQQHGYSMENSALLLLASESMPELEIANLYREFNRFGITVTSISHATKYAITDHYNPVETTHFVEMSQSLDVQSVELSLLHAQYMIDYPIVIGGDSANRFKIQPLEARSKVIYPSSQFALWLSSKTPTGYGYFI